MRVSLHEDGAGTVFSAKHVITEQWQGGIAIDTAETSGETKRYVVERDNAKGLPETFGTGDMLLRG